jgi:hypothetical protein
MPKGGFVDDLLSAMPTPQARMMAVATLSKYAGESVYIPAASKRARRVQAACNMLASGMSPTDAAAAIAARFQVSRRSAERDISAAKNVEKKCRDSLP